MTLNRVLISGLSGSIGGVESFLRSYVPLIQQAGIPCDFLVNVDRCAYEDVFTSIGSRTFHTHARSQNVIQYQKEIRAFFLEHAHEYMAIWVNKCMLNNIDNLKHAKKSGIPIRIIHAHNSANMDRNVKGRLQEGMHAVHRHQIGMYATHFWACSGQAAEWFYPPRLLSGSTYQLVPNAIDAAQFRYSQAVRQDVRKQLGLADDTLVIGHVGRFQYQKNHAYLLRVFREVHRRRSNSILLLVGQGEEESSIRAQVCEWGLEKAVRFLGVREDIPQLLQAMDVFVLPSRFEGLGIVLIEAQAAGLPCFASANVIPDEAKISPLLHWIPLDDGPAAWAEQILALQTQRQDMYAEIVHAGYDIHEAAAHVSAFFSAIRNGCDESGTE